MESRNKPTFERFPDEDKLYGDAVFKILNVPDDSAIGENANFLFETAFALFVQQSMLSRRPDLEPHLVGADGMVLLKRPWGDVVSAPAGYSMLVRGTRDQWQVVGWPVAYGSETPASVCFESNGDVRVGDAKGSDDCAKIPCL